MKYVGINQHGQVIGYFTHPRKELKELLPGRIHKMYVDQDGKSYHVGYVVGHEWITIYKPHQKRVNF